ncbi:HlyC/CorC family transporter [Thiohalorhabdus sp. Cl-TMA]|uniref:HlyC/CorC family transporter n=1 Tax=Thiohalorhabdus methylotrophus TaxID=3242694 RepID=A0ABV4U1H5_9GAMM
MNTSLGTLFVLLGILLALSGFFSGSETAMMALNKYRLRHRADQGHRGARIASKLLERPDRLIGVILLGNNFVNIAAASVSSIIALRLMGEAGLFLSTIILTVVVLIFSELAPKTMAATYPERLAFVAAPVLRPLLLVLYPLVVAINAIANTLLRALRLTQGPVRTSLSEEELRTVIVEESALLPARRQRMLLNIFELSRVTVADVMVPRTEMTIINIDADWGDILAQFRASPHTRFPVYRRDPDHIVGVIHGKDLLKLEDMETGEPSRETISALVREPYFIPDTTPLQEQLIQFQRRRQHMGLVVDEYGDVVGLVTLEDILEEIVGEIQDEHDLPMRGIRPQKDGSLLVDAQIEVRDLNRQLGWDLTTGGPRTLAGLIIEELESIPNDNTSLKVGGHPMEVVKTRSQTITVVRVYPDDTQRGWVG